MNNKDLRIVAMAEKCRGILLKANPGGEQLPPSLRQDHLLWMCDKIEHQAENWPDTRLHRWIGFVQAALIANRLLDLETAKQMFDRAKIAHADSFADGDLVDHLDPHHSFDLEIGGEG
jgi:hypothetical protein